MSLILMSMNRVIKLGDIKNMKKQILIIMLILINLLIEIRYINKEGV